MEISIKLPVFSDRLLERSQGGGAQGGANGEGGGAGGQQWGGGQQRGGGNSEGINRRGVFNL